MCKRVRPDDGPYYIITLRQASLGLNTLCSRRPWALNSAPLAEPESLSTTFHPHPPSDLQPSHHASQRGSYLLPDTPAGTMDQNLLIHLLLPYILFCFLSLGNSLSLLLIHLKPLFYVPHFTRRLGRACGAGPVGPGRGRKSVV